MNDPGDISFERPEVIRALQDQLLRDQIMYVSRYSPFYQRMFTALAINPASITSVDDLPRLPFTTKTDLSRQNRDFICVPQTSIIEFVTTSGTLGSPVTLALNESDLQRLAWNECESLRIATGTAEDIYQIMVTLDKRFMAGMAYYLGARKLGAGIIRSGVDSPAFQLDTIERLLPTALIAVPSFILKLLDFAHRNHVDLAQSSVRKIICIGEPVRQPDLQPNALARRIRDQWDVPLYSTYASTEMATAFTECPAGQGGHHLPQLVVTELIDVDDQPVPDGQPGELVITTLGVEGMPLIRFRTGDICRRYSAPCPCGRQTYRLGPIEGRRQQMIKYKGTSLYPAALFDVLNDFEEIANYVIRLSSDAYGMDVIRIAVVAEAEDPGLIARLQEEFQRHVRVVPDIVRITHEELQHMTDSPMSRKAIRLIDDRNHQK